MSYSLRILGWQSKGLRCPDVNIDFGEKSKVDFIQMLNGAGKTSTLMMLKVALTGTTNIARFDTELEEKNAVGNIHELVHKDSAEGSFSIRTLINNKSYDFSFKVNKKINNIDAIKFYTRSQESMGTEDGWSPPNGADIFLNPNFIDVFVFDAEKTDIIFSPKKDNAKKAIDTVCQIDVIDKANKYISRSADERLRKIGSKGSKQSDTMLRNKIEANKIYLSGLKSGRKETEEKIKKFQMEIDTLEDSIRKNKEENEEYRLKNIKLKKRETENNEATNTSQDKIFKLILSPMNLSDTTRKHLVRFSETLDKASLPANVASNFFTDISRQEVCICGNKIEEEEKKYILENKDQYLDVNLTSTLGTVLDFIRNDENHKARDIESLDNLIENLTKLDRAKYEIQSESQILENKHGDNKKNEEAARKCGELEKENKALIDFLRDYDEGVTEFSLKSAYKDIETTLSIKTVERVIQELEDKLYVEKEARNIAKIKILVNDTLSIVAKTAKEKIIQKLIININKKVAIILQEMREMPEVLNIDNNIQTEPSKLNKASQKVMNYVFFDEALKFCNLKLPFIVDSPVGAMDGINRKNWAKDIPHITDQFITFITPTDRYDFFEHLVKEAREDNCSFHTIFYRTEKANEWLENQDINSEVADLTDISGCVQGIEFMQSFNLVGNEDD